MSDIYYEGFSTKNCFPLITPLLHLKPIGLYTPNVESITSYISRLSAFHHLSVGEMVGGFLAPKLGKEYLALSAQYGGSRFYESSSALLGVGKEAHDWASLLNEYTGNTNLERLTMLGWKKQLPSRRLIKPSRSWCPYCIEEMHEIIYEPLVWSLQVIDFCDKHNCSLDAQCPHCQCRNHHVNRKHKPGYCNRCGGWLGMALNELPGIDCTHSGLENRLSFLFTSSSSALPGEIDLHKQLSLLMKTTSQGRLGHFSRLLNKPKSTVWGWTRGSNKPSLAEQVAICELFDISFEQLYCGSMVNIKQSSQHIGTDFHPPEKRKAAFNSSDDLERTHAILENIATKDRGMYSMRTVAKQVGVSIRTLYKYYPELCRQISSNHKQRKIKETHNTVD